MGKTANTGNELYLAMAESSMAGVYIIQEGKFVFVNPNASKFSGYSSEELIDMDNMQLVHPDDRKKLQANSAAMLKGKRKTPYEYRIISKTGKEKFLIETSAPIDYQGKKAILSNSMDITELRETRIQLDELQALENSILNTITNAVFGVQNKQIIFANQAAERIFGWKVTDLIGTPPMMLFRSEERFQ